MNKRGKVARNKAEDDSMSQSKGLKAYVKAIGSSKGFKAGEWLSSRLPHTDEMGTETRVNMGEHFILFYSRKRQWWLELGSPNEICEKSSDLKYSFDLQLLKLVID